MALAASILCVALAAACTDPVSSRAPSSAAPTSSAPAAVAPAGSSSASSSAKPAPSGSADPLAGYLLYEDAAGGYSIMLPAKPSPPIETPVERNGNQVIEHTVPLRIGTSAYSISYADGALGPELTEPGQKQHLQGVLAQAFRDLGATLEATVDASAGDLAGLEGRGTHPTQGKVRVRVFERRTKTNVRQYRIVIMGDQPDDVAAAVLGSFKLMK